MLQEINKCCADSIPPHPVTQDRVAEGMIPRIVKLSFVGNLSRNSLQAKIDTFRGICLCQMRFAPASKESTR
ncbi:hypothetical protein A2U01_0053189 [Trifolium medium]|uniref:Uncharacterized protein n=1 Tax=Trifolium medium TaxID=97028 RepID=A0A392R6W2_9FABA|nr:hypothetical protein [Trifolium medium]